MSSFMVVDLQFGSTGKGNIGYYLTKKHGIQVAVAANMPNAGHTAVDGKSRYVSTVLPASAYAPSVKYILIGPGSVWDPDKLIEECQSPAIAGKRIFIHSNSVPLIPEDAVIEQRNLISVGSTMKGSGAANSRRISRATSAIVAVNNQHLQDHLRKMVRGMPISMSVGAQQYGEILDTCGDSIMVEGSQGFSLSVYHGAYPYTTSRDCTPASLASDCGLPTALFKKLVIVGSLRTYPIRVANRYDEDGKLIGTSGPRYSDQEEITWESLGLQPELTTVTKLPRRVFTFSRSQVTEACRMCAPDGLFLNFCNYCTPDELDHLRDYLSIHCAPVCWEGHGPDIADIKEKMS